MNPWGIVLVALGILLVMIGFLGKQHEILQVFKGIPASARGTTASAPASNSNTGTPPVLATPNNPTGGIV